MVLTSPLRDCLLSSPLVFNRKESEQEQDNSQPDHHTEFHPLAGFNRVLEEQEVKSADEQGETPHDGVPENDPESQHQKPATEPCRFANQRVAMLNAEEEVNHHAQKHGNEDGIIDTDLPSIKTDKDGLEGFLNVRDDFKDEAFEGVTSTKAHHYAESQPAHPSEAPAKDSVEHQADDQSDSPPPTVSDAVSQIV